MRLPVQIRNQRLHVQYESLRIRPSPNSSACISKTDRDAEAPTVGLSRADDCAETHRTVRSPTKLFHAVGVILAQVTAFEGDRAQTVPNNLDALQQGP